MLEVDTITVAYGEAIALHEVSLNVSEGEVVAVVGPNGAGKSTLLAAISGTKPVTGGDIRLQGVSIARGLPENIVRKGVALVPEGRRIFASLSVEENLRLGATPRADRKEAARDMEQMMETFPILREYRRTSAGRLSGGEQQQLAIARALVSRPRLLLLDEPSLGLAPMTVRLVYERLAELRSSGMTVLLVEQSVDLALTLADRLYVLHSGAVAFVTSAGSAADRRALEHAYFGYTASSP
ncbi:MAG: ABC transporter ATP-binding protein [Candidatus Nephthysia bennettiae]|uniref:ABC transporter ATP-binding protein n=1 Tax=Candidatus Nephthysia bennettiae TaxID=3127016 RepID=A0A934K6E7_9BACT|nr:ABC transporter ATP-binding protein [Candidatus Dormibacteraeota bacterium]MBJ7612998.1 ABC transporter ATP-binding protein [Candidatus Dormibacteraeota bacterium]PZR92951.1 MAG: ABC transporter ATP-binding protein [Candidatus Dormibacteraeota bacterium]